MWENSLLSKDTGSNNHGVSQIGRELWWSLSSALWSLQDYLQINHMTKSIVHTLTELWHTEWCDHSPGKPVSGCDWPPSGWRAFSQCPVWVSLDAASFHFLVAHHRSPERGEQDLPLHCTHWGSCRLRWGHSSAFFTCLQGLSLSLSLFSVHTLLVWCPSYIEVPKAAHGTRGEARSAQSREGKS